MSAIPGKDEAPEKGSRSALKHWSHAPRRYRGQPCLHGGTGAGKSGALVFSSVLPVHNYTPGSQDLFAARSPEKILALNRWLKDYCVTNGLLYLDYFTPMVDDKGLLKTRLGQRRPASNAAGYKIMAPLAEPAIGKALAGSPQ
jgi:lysophospholipase L1-like esterase